MGFVGLGFEFSVIKDLVTTIWRLNENSKMVFHASHGTTWPKEEKK